MVHFETFNKRPKKKKHLYQQEVQNGVPVFNTEAERRSGSI